MKPKTAKTKVKAQASTDSPMALIEISLPKAAEGRDWLQANALDSHSRDLARQTSITVGGKILACQAFRVLENGNVQLTVEAPCIKFVVREKAPAAQGGL